MKQVRSWLMPIKEFSICGINVFDSSKNEIISSNYCYDLEPEEISDVDNSWVEYSSIKCSNLSHYKIVNYDFYIAISQVDAFYLITLFVEDGFPVPPIDDKTYSSLNKYMLYQLTTNEKEGVIYSKNKKYRVVIVPRDDGLFLYTIEAIKVNGWAMIDFPRYSSEIYKDYFCFDYIRESIFGTKEDAIRNAKMELENL